MLSKENRLKKSSNFERAHKRGKHIPGKFGKFVIYNRDDNDPSKFGVVVSADKGNAAKRNKAKRIIRHNLRSFCDRSKGYDIFYVVWKIDFSSFEIDKEIEAILKNEICNNGIN